MRAKAAIPRLSFVRTAGDLEVAAGLAALPLVDDSFSVHLRVLVGNLLTENLF